VSSIPQRVVSGIEIPEGFSPEKVAVRLAGKTRQNQGCSVFRGSPVHIGGKRYAPVAVACEVAGISTKGKYIVRECESLHCIAVEHVLVLSLEDAVLYDARRRFFAKVKKLPGRDACWTWLAAPSGSQGYGSFTFNGKRLLAHQAALKLEGVETGEAFVCHRCDNPRCVRPAHLFLGTHQENMEDCSRKGRVGGMKLKPDQVREIRRRHVAGESLLSLSHSFNVTKNNIRMIVLRKTWRYI
jgi:hypothetical protein